MPGFWSSSPMVERTSFLDTLHQDNREVIVRFLAEPGDLEDGQRSTKWRRSLPEPVLSLLFDEQSPFKDDLEEFFFLSVHGVICFLKWALLLLLNWICF